MAEQKSEFIPSEDIFTQEELCMLAAKHKGLTLKAGRSPAVCEPLATIKLTEIMLRKLAELGIKRHEQPGYNFTLMDENPQEPAIMGWANSCGWTFTPVENGDKGPRTEATRTLVYDLHIDLHVELRLNQTERNIVCVPLAYGASVSPTDALPNFRMFKALVEIAGGMPDVAREIAASEGWITIPWTKLGLAGLCEIKDLFHEFCHGKHIIKDLARYQKVFDPAPFNEPNAPPSARRFVAKVAQPRLFRCWKNQLDEYRSKLTV
ncbi:MAG: hypothetical protein WC551_05485 [Patescibacteria group bacterium]